MRLRQPVRHQIRVRRDPAQRRPVNPPPEFGGVVHFAAESPGLDYGLHVVAGVSRTGGSDFPELRVDDRIELVPLHPYPSSVKPRFQPQCPLADPGPTLPGPLQGGFPRGPARPTGNGLLEA